MGAVLALITVIYEPFKPPKASRLDQINEDTVEKDIPSDTGETNPDTAPTPDLNGIDANDENVTIAWLKYWEENGTELIIKSWLHHYKDYFNQDFDASQWATDALNTTIGENAINEENALDSPDIGAGDSVNTNLSDTPDAVNIGACDANLLWQEEWVKHCGIVYQEEYQKFVQHYSEAEFENMSEDVKNNPKLRKYWFQRYLLFSKYDFGIQLDEESWFSVTPEKIAEHIARKCHARVGGVIIDGFCGVGGNTIQFAKFYDKVIAIDLDPVKIEYAKNNAIIYGVADKIDFRLGNFMELAPELEADVIFLSPPWGGPNYTVSSSFDLWKMKPLTGPEIFQVAQTVSSNIAFYAPRNVNKDQLSELAGPGNIVEIEENKFKGRVKAITAYYGELIHPRLRKKARKTQEGPDLVESNITTDTPEQIDSSNSLSETQNGTEDTKRLNV